MNKTVYSAQIYLNKLGFDIGAVDGVMGQLTAAALIVYQFCKKISITGALDDVTIKLLMQDVESGKKVKDIYQNYIPVNLEKGGGGKRLQDKSYLKKEDLFHLNP